MSSRKRILQRTREVRWHVDYRDQGGARRANQFRTKGEAVAWETTMRGQVRDGTHVADSGAITVEQAGKIWIAACEANKLEASTLRQYRNHLKHHINPLIEATKLSRFTTPAAQDFVDTLLKDRNLPTVRKVTTSLKMMLSASVLRGKVAFNAASEVKIPTAERQEKGVEEGVEFPTKEEIRLLLDCVADDFRPFVHTAIFTGLRPSEMRGLRWDDVDLKKNEIHVRQRADRFNKLGAPKSKKGRRHIPLGPRLVKVLAEWSLSGRQSSVSSGWYSPTPAALSKTIPRYIVPSARYR
jgi:integrase